MVANGRKWSLSLSVSFGDNGRGVGDGRGHGIIVFVGLNRDIDTGDALSSSPSNVVAKPKRRILLHYSGTDSLKTTAPKVLSNDTTFHVDPTYMLEAPSQVARLSKSTHRTRISTVLASLVRFHHICTWQKQGTCKKLATAYWQREEQHKIGSLSS